MMIVEKPMNESWKIYHDTFFKSSHTNCTYILKNSHTFLQYMEKNKTYQCITTIYTCTREDFN